MSIATKTGEWSNVHRLRRTSRKPRRSGLSKAARETLRQKPSRAERAASAPPLAWPSTSTAAFIAPADVPEMASICSQGSSSRRSRAPQVKAPCAPPPCSAKSIRTRSRSKVSALLVAAAVLASRRTAVLCLLRRVDRDHADKLEDSACLFQRPPNEAAGRCDRQSCADASLLQRELTRHER